jgi:pimeloyl-ACP methyl ester carboxylesterase
VDLDERFSWQERQIAWCRSGSGPAVVFCHGTPFSSELWKPFAALLGHWNLDRPHVIAHDIGGAVSGTYRLGH